MLTPCSVCSFFCCPVLPVRVRDGTIGHTPRCPVAAYRQSRSDSLPEDGATLQVRPPAVHSDHSDGHGQTGSTHHIHRTAPEAGADGRIVVEMDALAVATGMQQGVCVAVDVRPSSAWEGGHIPGAIPLPDGVLYRWLPGLFARYAMRRRLARLLRLHTGRMLVFCSEAADTCPSAGRGCRTKSGFSSSRGNAGEGGRDLAQGCPCLAHRWLEQALRLDARNVAMLCGGMAAWRSAGLPLLHGCAAGDIPSACPDSG